MTVFKLHAPISIHVDLWCEYFYGALYCVGGGCMRELRVSLTAVTSNFLEEISRADGDFVMKNNVRICYTA